MTAFGNALARASRGLDWSYPCLIWVADYLLDETGRDFAAGWRDRSWTESAAVKELLLLGRGSGPGTPVERALETIANRHGWDGCDGPRQGSIMIGVFTDGDKIGVPAIFDGQDRWLFASFGRAQITRNSPIRVWEVPRESIGGASGLPFDSPVDAGRTS